LVVVPRSLKGGEACGTRPSSYLVTRKFSSSLLSTSLRFLSSIFSITLSSVSSSGVSSPDCTFDFMASVRFEKFSPGKLRSLLCLSNLFTFLVVLQFNDLT
jgi:hypothetical protein